MSFELEIYWDGGTDQDGKKLLPPFRSMGMWGNSVYQEGYLFCNMTRHPTPPRLEAIARLVKKYIPHATNIKVLAHICYIPKQK